MKILVITLILGTYQGFAQDVDSKTVLDPAPWSSARAAGLGGTLSGLADGIDAAYFNPAGIGGLFSTPGMIEMEKRFSDRAVDFIYMFSHDTTGDIGGFIKEYKVNGISMKVNLNVTSDFHQAQLPTVFVADRNNWLVMRFSDIKLKDLDVLSEYLEIHTGY